MMFPRVLFTDKEEEEKTRIMLLETCKGKGSMRDFALVTFYLPALALALSLAGHANPDLCL